MIVNIRCSSGVILASDWGIMSKMCQLVKAWLPDEEVEIPKIELCLLSCGDRDPLVTRGCTLNFERNYGFRTRDHPPDHHGSNRRNHA